MTPKFLSASSISGTDVVNTQDENLGSIEDLMINLEGTGGIQYAVLSFGGFLGLGDKLFAVPFEQLRSHPKDEKFVLDVDKEKLKDAPGFNKDNWPNFADQTFRDSLTSFYTA